jgi:hypothetical protein
MSQPATKSRTTIEILGVLTLVSLFTPYFGGMVVLWILYGLYKIFEV